MRIVEMKLKNFRSHESTYFRFNRINVIRGSNGAGKTSIAMAIELALTGRCQVTDAAGKGADDLITITEREALVELFLDTLTEPQLTGWLTRRQTRSGQTTTIGTNAGKAAMAVIESRCGRIPLLSAVLNSHRFLEMDAKEQKALLADSLGSEPVEIDESILEDAQSVSPNTVSKTIDSAAEVDRIYSIFFNMRTLAKRELKNLGDLNPPEIPEDAPSLESARTKLEGLRTQKDLLIQERAQLQRDYQKASDTYFEAVKKLREVEDHVLESAELERLDAIAKSKSKATKLDQEIATLRAQISTARSSLSELMKPQQTSCPTCGQAVAVEDRTASIAQLEENIKQYEQQLTEKKQEREKLGDPDEAKRKIEKHGECSGIWATADKTVKNGAPVEPTLSDLTQQIEELVERIANGQQIVEKLAKLEGAREHYERQQGQKNILSTRIESLERLVEYFSDKGAIKARLVGGKLPGFVQRINAVLIRFGFCCWLSLDPYRLDVARLIDGQMFRPNTELGIHQLSESEQYRFSIAFQIALAEVTGVGMVIIDRADMLTTESRRLLTAELLDSYLDQAFLLSTGEPMTEFPDIVDVAFFELENADGKTGIRAQHSKEAYANR